MQTSTVHYDEGSELITVQGGCPNLFKINIGHSGISPQAIHTAMSCIDIGRTQLATVAAPKRLVLDIETGHCIQAKIRQHRNSLRGSHPP